MEALGSKDLDDGRAEKSVVKVVARHGDQSWPDSERKLNKNVKGRLGRQGRLSLINNCARVNGNGAE